MDHEQQLEQDQQHQLDQQMQSLQQEPDQMEDVIACVNTLDAALFPCLHEIVKLKAAVPDFEAPLTELERPATEPQATDGCPTLLRQTDVEKHAGDFMEAAKKLQQYFISLQRENKPTKSETLRKEIAAMEEDLKKKKELIQKQEKLIQQWKEKLRERWGKHNCELERV